LNSYFDNDIVYSQGDQAEEIFFLFHGEVLFYKDVSDIIDMREVVRMEAAFNIPFASYSTGSYFGDNDAILNKNGQRAYTCVCQQDSQLYSIKTPVLNEILLRYKTIKNLMT
jgi:CRP-like cAMP-binding protein